MKFLAQILFVSACAAAPLSSPAQWKMAGDKIATRWGAGIDPACVLAEYPRPQMARGQWLNLNGLWDYAIADAGAEYAGADGKILVPFAVEAPLSGVGRKLGADRRLWYARKFEVPKQWGGKRIMLNFGAVDYSCKVFVNNALVAEHEGGYEPFSADITGALRGGENDLKICVADATDDPKSGCLQPRGKQSLNPPWYIGPRKVRHGFWPPYWRSSSIRNEWLTILTGVLPATWRLLAGLSRSLLTTHWSSMSQWPR